MQNQWLQICNKKLISDDIGEKYSVTRKQLKNGTSKLPFEKTPTCKIIIGRIYYEIALRFIG